jgi:protein-S-isoprenylcysteine O-methyltransferase Ste14
MSFDSDLFQVSYVVGMIAASAIRLAYTSTYRASERSRKAPPIEAILLMLMAVGMFIGPVVYLLTSWFDGFDYSLPAPLGVLGIILFASGTILLWRSHADLGGSWTPVIGLKEEHRLVTSGVYSRIRHPMYAAHLLWALAQPLLIQNWLIGLATLVFLIPLYIERVPREERMMRERFGEEYEDYMKGTGMLLPRFRGK